MGTIFPHRMRWLKILGWLAAAILVTYIAFRGWSFLPRAYRAFHDEAAPHMDTTALDTTLFESDFAAAADSMPPDSALSSILERAGDTLRVASHKRNSVINEGVRLPLYTLELHEGVPLPEIAFRGITLFQAAGFEILESRERAGGKYPWVLRLGRKGAAVAIVRARVSAPPLPGSFRIGIAFWADSLPPALLQLVERLPRGAVLVVPREIAGEARVRAMARSEGIDIALALRLETAFLPLARQEERRLLLHHSPREVESRLESPAEPVPPPVGVVAVHGERGVADPKLTAALARAARDRGMWILDATGADASRLLASADSVGARAIRPLPLVGGNARERLYAAGDAAVRAGSAICVLPLDSASVRLAAEQVPFLAKQGVSVVRLGSFAAETPTEDGKRE